MRNGRLKGMRTRKVTGRRTCTKREEEKEERRGGTGKNGRGSQEHGVKSLTPTFSSGGQGTLFDANLSCKITFYYSLWCILACNTLYSHHNYFGFVPDLNCMGDQ